MKKLTTLAALCGAVLCSSTLNTGNIVTDRTAVSSTTIVKNGGKGPGNSGMWLI